MQKINHYVVTGEIELLSGMRIGGSDDVLQIGGTDLTCIKDPVTGKPYIPGSSLKGKMRSSIERDGARHSKYDHNAKRQVSDPDGDEPCCCAQDQCPVCRVFGPHKNTTHNLGPGRVIVRDAPVIGAFCLESKTESSNDRKSGTAKNPRTVERVAPGARFALEIGLQVFDLDEKQGRQFKYKDVEGSDAAGAHALLQVVDHALYLVAEETGIGSGVTKGYGKVAITNLKCQQLKRSRMIPPCDLAVGKDA